MAGTIEALELQEEVYKLRKEQLGESHPDTLVAMNNLAMTYCDLGRLQEALELQEKVYKSCVEQLGETHPDTLTAMGNIVAIYDKLGRAQ